MTEEQAIVNKICKGMVHTLAKDTSIEELEWNDHPAFKGVAIKHLVTGRDTSGHFSAHLVHVQAGCEIGAHIHEGKWELHEVVDGQGECVIVEKTIQYQAGVMALIPPDFVHIVKADTDLYLLAKFIPALL
jgi:quercetin dioxygenase-like cupin family protein